LLIPEHVKISEGKVEALHMDLTELISTLKQSFDLETAESDELGYL